MIKATDIINEISIQYPKSVDRSVIEKLLVGIVDKMNANDVKPDYDDEDDIGDWETITRFNVEHDSDTVRFKVWGRGREEFMERVQKLPLTQKYGWFVRRTQDEMIVLEPVHQSKSFKVPRYLYHFTNEENADNVLTYGLIPTLSIGKHTWHDLAYPPRIYLTQEPDAPMHAHPQVTFRIDTRKLRGVIFYEDTSWGSPWKSAVWTDVLIPPEAIELITR